MCLRARRRTRCRHVCGGRFGNELLTADAMFFESVGAAEFPVNAAAAAISVDTALYGSAAAF